LYYVFLISPKISSSPHQDQERQMGFPYKAIIAGCLALCCLCCGAIQAEADNSRVPVMVDMNYFQDRVKRQRDAMKTVFESERL
jgi:hypothetical protein